jgi:hypothetical protein
VVEGGDEHAAAVGVNDHLTRMVCLAVSKMTSIS